MYNMYKGAKNQYTSALIAQSLSAHFFQMKVHFRIYLIQFG